MGMGEVLPQPFASLKLMGFDQSSPVAPAPARKPNQGTFIFIDHDPGMADVCVDPTFAQREMPGAIGTDVRPLRIRNRGARLRNFLLIEAAVYA
jgi:hypothetical protein